MPFVIQSSVAKNVILGVWRIDESVIQLKSILNPGMEDSRYFETLKSDLRRKQWLSYRIAINHLTFPEKGELIYDEFGKPQFKDQPWQLSVSHSGNYAAVIIGKEKRVGIDIEILKPRVERIANRFLSEEELSSVGNENRLEKLYVYWGAKESLYKLYGKPEIDFRSNIIVEPFIYLCTGIGQCRAILKTGEMCREFCIYYRTISDYLLVYTLER